jgi:UDP-N-acetylmuramoyl-L-alanyl-D-glutamate--2,6-diaminopimelate ligase
MDAYFEAKARLFEPGRCDRAVVCVDDPWGRRLARRIEVPLRACSLQEATDLEVGPLHSTFVLRGCRVRLGLGGRHNARNAVIAAATAEVLGVGPSAVAEGLRRAPGVPGRFEPVDAGQPFAVLVDYSHTPDALRAALEGCREAAGGGRVVVVFGCGGERDHAKRPEMGAIATDLADLAVLTSDNPRHEDPASIIAEVRAGVTRSDRLLVEPDRAAAIALGLDRATRGDVVLIAGKGHEQYQDLGDERRPFDDRTVARAHLLGAFG